MRVDEACDSVETLSFCVHGGRALPGCARCRQPLSVSAQGTAGPVIQLYSGLSAMEDRSRARFCNVCHLAKPLEDFEKLTFTCKACVEAKKVENEQLTQISKQLRTRAVSDPGERPVSPASARMSELIKGMDALPAAPRDTENLAKAREFVEPSALSPQDIHIVKTAWNKLIAWKGMAMECMLYHWITTCQDVYSKLHANFDEMGENLFHLFDLVVRKDLDTSTEVYNRESYQLGFPCHKLRPYDTSRQYFIWYALLGVVPDEWTGLKKAFIFALKNHVPYAQHLELQVRAAAWTP